MPILRRRIDMGINVDIKAETHELTHSLISKSWETSINVDIDVWHWHQQTMSMSNALQWL